MKLVFTKAAQRRPRQHRPAPPKKKQELAVKMLDVFLDGG